MLRIQYEQSLVETAVFLAIRKDEQLECAFHQVIDPLYAIEDLELRQREFSTVFRDFFARLRLGQTLVALVAECPLIEARVDRCVVREASRKKAESAEMFAKEADDGTTLKRTLLLQVCPESLTDPLRLIPRMRRELLHVADMLDDRFGYGRQSLLGASSQQGLLRDRYRVLWDVYVEGRLARKGRMLDVEIERLQQAFRRVFASSMACSDSGAFRRVFDAPELTHDVLLDYAKDPQRLVNSSAASADLSSLSI